MADARRQIDPDGAARAVEADVPAAAARPDDPPSTTQGGDRRGASGLRQALVTAGLLVGLLAAGTAAWLALRPSPEQAAADEARRRLAEAVVRERAAGEARRKAEEEAARTTVEEKEAAEARRAAEQEVAARTAAEEKAAAEQAAARRREEEQRQAADEKARADAVARDKAEADEDARRKAEEDRRLAAAEAQRREDEAVRKAEEERAAQEAARRKEDEERAAQEAARRQEEEDRARAEAELRRTAEESEALLQLGDLDRKRVQAGLTAHGFDAGAADGTFSARTREMIATFQRARGETETGYLTQPQFADLSRDGEQALAKADEERAKAEAKRKEEARRKAAAAAAPRTDAGIDGAWTGALNCITMGPRPVRLQIAGGRGASREAGMSLGIGASGPTVAINVVITSSSGYEYRGNLAGRWNGTAVTASGTLKAGSSETQGNLECTVALRRQ